MRPDLMNECNEKLALLEAGLVRMEALTVEAEELLAEVSKPKRRFLDRLFGGALPFHGGSV